MVLDRKAKASSSTLKSRQEVVDCDLILDTEIDKLLDEKAAKSNLTVFNVKSILRQLIQNQMVQQVLDVKVRRKEREEKSTGVQENSGALDSGSEVDGVFCFEPKLTRAKTKELIQNNEQFRLPLWPISPAKLLQLKPPPSETQILITAQDLPEESEAEDDEYIPKEADYQAIQSDDDVSMTSLSDIGSPATPTIHRFTGSTRRRESIFGSPGRLISTQDDSVFKTPSPKKQIRRFPRDNAIGLRTRSKLPLNDTPLEVLEQQLIPPDITTDMYEWNGSDNEDYTEFLQTFSFSAVPDGGNDDEEADPEYNAMEDEEDDHDKEEHRVDRAVKVSKKEVNQLIAELFDGYQPPTSEDVDDLLYSISQPNIPSESKVETVSAHGGVISSVTSTETQIVSTSRPTGLNSANLESRPVLSGSLPTVLTATQHNTDSNNVPRTDLENHAHNFTEIPIAPVTTPFILVSPSQAQNCNVRTSMPYPHTKSEVPPVSAELFTWEMHATLRHQMQKHIQLLATTYVICSGLEDPQVLKAAQCAKSLLMEISTSDTSSGHHSVYAGKNLKPAIDLIRIWPPRLNFNNNSPIKKKILEDYNRSSCKDIPDYERRLIKLIAESPAFMYPSLLPPYFLSSVCSSSPSTGSSTFFLPSEDNLVVRGMDELKEKKLSIHEIAKIICQTILPGRTPLQIVNRIKNAKKKPQSTSVKPSSLKEYFERNILPVCQPDVYIPEEALAPIHQPSDLLEKRWAQFVDNVLQDTLLVNNSPKLAFLNKGGFLKNGRNKKGKVINVDAIEENPTGVQVSTSEYQVFTVTNDSGKPQFYYTIPTLSLYTNKGELMTVVDPNPEAPENVGEPGDGKSSENTATGSSSESSPESPLPESTNSQSVTEEIQPGNYGSGQGDEDEEDKERKKFHYEYDPTSDNLKDEHTETTDEESEQTKIHVEKTSLSSPDQKGMEFAEKTPNLKKRKRIPSGSASASAPPQARSVGTRGGTKRHKYNTTSVEQLLESSGQDDGDIVDAFAEAFLQSVRQKLEGKNPAIYSAFLQLLANDCVANDWSDGELYAKIEELLKDYPDLVKEFGGLQTAEAAFATGNFIQYRESHAQIHLLHLLEKWTVKCPQLKTKIIQKLKSLQQDTVLTEGKVVDVMQPLFSHIHNQLILDSFKALFPSVFRPHTVLSVTDFEEMDLEGRRFIHRARLNLLPINGRPWKKPGEKGCRRCSHGFECLTHILNVCPQGRQNMTKRHNDIVRRIKTAVGDPKTGCTLLYENQTIPGDTSGERPDLIIKKGREIYLIDVTIPSENGEDSFKAARERKRRKYHHLRAILWSAPISSVTVDAFIIGSLGSWDPDNKDVLQLFTSALDKRLFRNMCVSNVIKWSRVIYHEHDTGKRITGAPAPSQLH